MSTGVYQGTKRKSRISKGDQVSGILFALPWILGILIFFAYPLLSSIYFSLTDFNGQTVNAFLGFRNFTNLFADRDGTFWISIRNTLIYTAMAVPSVILLGLCLALVMNIKSRVQGIYRVLAFLPTLVPAVATGVIWQWLLRPYLEEPSLAIPALVFITWWGLGSGLIILLAGLQDVPETYYEAAALDGASAWKKFRHVTLPLISPVLFFRILTDTIGALQQFALPYLVGGSQGGVLNSMLFYNVRLFNAAFSEFRMGQASAMAWLAFIVIALVTLIIYRTSKYWVHYMGGD